MSDWDQAFDPDAQQPVEFAFAKFYFGPQGFYLWQTDDNNKPDHADVLTQELGEDPFQGSYRHQVYGWVRTAIYANGRSISDVSAASSSPYELQKHAIELAAQEIKKQHPEGAVEWKGQPVNPKTSQHCAQRDWYASWLKQAELEWNPRGRYDVGFKNGWKYMYTPEKQFYMWPVTGGAPHHAEKARELLENENDMIKPGYHTGVVDENGQITNLSGGAQNDDRREDAWGRGVWRDDEVRDRVQQWLLENGHEDMVAMKPPEQDEGWQAFAGLNWTGDYNHNLAWGNGWKFAITRAGQLHMWPTRGGEPHHMTYMDSHPLEAGDRYDVNGAVSPDGEIINFGGEKLDIKPKVEQWLIDNGHADLVGQHQQEQGWDAFAAAEGPIVNDFEPFLTGNEQNIEYGWWKWLHNQHTNQFAMWHGDEGYPEAFAQIDQQMYNPINGNREKSPNLPLHHGDVANALYGPMGWYGQGGGGNLGHGGFDYGFYEPNSGISRFDEKKPGNDLADQWYKQKYGEQEQKPDEGWDAFATHDKLASMLGARIRKLITDLPTTGGFSLTQGYAPANGQAYFVAEYGHERAVPLPKATPAILAEVRDQAKALGPDRLIGAWYNSEDHLVYFDVAQALQDLNQATEMAEKNQQLAIWDGFNQRELRWDGAKYAMTDFPGKLKAMFTNIVSLPGFEDWQPDLEDQKVEEAEAEEPESKRGWGWLRPQPQLQFAKTASQAMYHVAPRIHRDQIQRQGLIPSTTRKLVQGEAPQSVHLWDRYGAAQQWTESPGSTPGDHDIWHVHAGGLPLEPDPAFPAAHRTSEKIGPERLTLVSPGSPGQFHSMRQPVEVAPQFTVPGQQLQFAKTAAMQKWLYLNGRVMFHDHPWFAAHQLGIETGMKPTDAQQVANWIATGNHPRGLGVDVAMGTMLHGRPAIWFSTVDRNKVYDAVTDELNKTNRTAAVRIYYHAAYQEQRESIATHGLDAAGRGQSRYEPEDKDWEQWEDPDWIDWYKNQYVQGGNYLYTDLSAAIHWGVDELGGASPGPETAGDIWQVTLDDSQVQPDPEGRPGAFVTTEPIPSSALQLLGNSWSLDQTNRTAGVGGSLPELHFTFEQGNGSKAYHDFAATGAEGEPPEEYFTGDGDVLSAFVGERLVGELHVSSYGEIANIWVEPELQRRGVATAMLEYLNEVRPDWRHSDYLEDDGEKWVNALPSHLAADDDWAAFNEPAPEYHPDDLIDSGQYQPGTTNAHDRRPWYLGDDGYIYIGKPGTTHGEIDSAFGGVRPKLGVNGCIICGVIAEGDSVYAYDWGDKEVAASEVPRVRDLFDNGLMTDNPAIAETSLPHEYEPGSNRLTPSWQ